jgi:alpha-tubulin suppressor-like RCC1 family protein
MAASLQNTCAAPAGQAMRCWGANMSGQIGDSTSTPRLVATPVLGIASALSIGVGHGHTCASSGTVLECWGDNAAGQLGIDSTTGSDTPVAVTLLPAGDIDDVSLGRDHTCAIVAGALYCWGNNSDGQLGLGSDTTTHRLRPTLVPLSELAVRVDSHSVHTCVLLVSGAIACFGANGDGQIGSGTGDVHTPALVPGITDAIDVGTGSSHTCALRRDGTVWCWGSDAFGQIGRGDSGELRVLVPTPTSAIPGTVVQIAVGSAYACALTRGGDVHCWGENVLGQAGRNRFTQPYVYEPAPVLGLGPIEEIAAGTEHTCLRSAAGVPLCFGDNTDGQLGNDSTTTSWMPVTVMGL